MPSPQPEERRRAQEHDPRRPQGMAELGERAERRAGSGPETTTETRWRKGGYPSSSRRASSSARNPATSCLAAYVIGVASGWKVWTSTLPGASRPLLPASCVTSWNVRSSARKSGNASPASASTTAATATPGKWWPLATICVPISAAAGEVAKRSSASRRAPGFDAVSASSRIRSRPGTRFSSSPSSRCVPAPMRASSTEPHSGQLSGSASEWPQ